jgi:hypothetical protein
MSTFRGVLFLCCPLDEVGEVGEGVIGVDGGGDWGVGPGDGVTTGLCGTEDEGPLAELTGWDSCKGTGSNGGAIPILL